MIGVNQSGPETQRARGKGVGTAALAVAVTMVTLTVIAALAIRSRSAKAAAPGIEGDTLPSLDESTSQLSGAVVVRGRAPGTMFVLADLTSHGLAPAQPPRARVTFFDVQGRVVGMGTCDSPVPVVRPGERAACSGQIDEVGASASHRIDLLPGSTAKERPMALPAALVRVVPPTEQESGVAEVAVTSATPSAIARVRIVVTLRDRAGGLAGLDHAEHPSAVAPGSTVTVRVPLRVWLAPAEDHAVAAWAL